jgi:hypothetical protein
MSLLFGTVTAAAAAALYTVWHMRRLPVSCTVTTPSVHAQSVLFAWLRAVLLLYCIKLRSVSFGHEYGCRLRPTFLL